MSENNTDSGKALIKTTLGDRERRGEEFVENVEEVLEE